MQIGRCSQSATRVALGCPKEDCRSAQSRSGAVGWANCHWGFRPIAARREVTSAHLNSARWVGWAFEMVALALTDEYVVKFAGEGNGLGRGSVVICLAFLVFGLPLHQTRSIRWSKNVPEYVLECHPTDILEIIFLFVF